MRLFFVALSSPESGTTNFPACSDSLDNRDVATKSPVAECVQLEGGRGRGDESVSMGG